MKLKKAALMFVTAAALAANTIPAFAMGFVHADGGTKYDWGGGNYCTGNWVRRNDHWYYFGDDQLMRTDWIQRDNTWYYAADTGELQAGIMNINGNVYYFDKQTCKMVTGLHEYDFDAYNFTENGVVGDSPYVNERWDSNGNLLYGQKNHVRGNI